MSTTLIVILIAVGAVALFVLAMSLTLILKGHHIDSEIATNKNMQRLGIKCAVQEASGGECPEQGGCALPHAVGSGAECASCDGLTGKNAPEKPDR